MSTVKVYKEENIHTGDTYAKVCCDGVVVLLTLWLGESDQELCDMAAVHAQSHGYRL